MTGSVFGEQVTTSAGLNVTAYSPLGSMRTVDVRIDRVPEWDLPLAHARTRVIRARIVCGYECEIGNAGLNSTTVGSQFATVRGDRGSFSRDRPPRRPTGQSSVCLRRLSIGRGCGFGASKFLIECTTREEECMANRRHRDLVLFGIGFPFKPEKIKSCKILHGYRVI